MALAAEKELKHIGETSGMEDHDHDLVHELNKRLDSLWRYDQYIANAEGKDKILQYWQDVKAQEEKNIERLRTLIAEEVKKDCF